MSESMLLAGTGLALGIQWPWGYLEFAVSHRRLTRERGCGRYAALLLTASLIAAWPFNATGEGPLLPNPPIQCTDYGALLRHDILISG